MTKGPQTKNLIAQGATNEAIVGLVGTTLNSVRWYRSKAKKAASSDTVTIDWALANNYDDQQVLKALKSNLTSASKQLFVRFVQDAPNWSGQPLVDVSPAERGNLTDLKAKGLVETFEDEGNSFVIFTDAGKELAASFGFELD